MLHYFAYGSNLHPLRLTERTPSARLLGITTLSHHRLTFHKRSHDGSGKCSLVKTDVAEDVVYGALYELDPAHKYALDRHEGKGLGYIEGRVRVQQGGREYTCFTYLAHPSHIVEDIPPYHWYKQMVLLGARYLAFPVPYVAAIEAVASVEDPDEDRRLARAGLIGKIERFG